jgi:hypothetical protein
VSADLAPLAHSNKPWEAGTPHVLDVPDAQAENGEVGAVVDLKVRVMRAKMDPTSRALVMVSA